eukprot:Gb_10295 [translate_table: standard]
MADQHKGFDKSQLQQMQVELNTLEGYVDWKGRPVSRDKHGGIRATMFVFAMEGFENMAFVANALNLVTYFHGVMYYDLADSANTLTNFMGTSFLLSLFGAFISDTYVSRLKTVIIFACLELVGYMLLTIQAHYPSLRPPVCYNASNPANNCQHVTGGKAAMLFMGLYLIALGTGGVKAALPSLGADQFDAKDNKERRLISSYFNYFLFSLCVGAAVGVTCIVWIQTNKGWDWGFGTSTGGIALSILSIVLGMSMYRNQMPGGSPLTRIAQVFVVAFRNRKLAVPENAGELHEVHDKEAALQIELLQNTNQFRFLDKAAILPEDYSREDEINPWHICTVTQVEEAKILLRMAPIFASTIVVNTCLAQLQTFSVQQGTTMDTHIGGFHIPPASLSVIPLIIIILLIPGYDRIFVPFARRITGHETGITHLQRIGVGLVLSAASMAIAGIVEVKRKNVAREHGMLDAIPVLQPLPINVFWLGFQYFIFGIADLFTFVGLMEFFYSQAPSGMKSLATAFSWCSLALGYYLSSIVVDIVNTATRNVTASKGWLAGNNLNRNHLNFFYWMLSALSILNFFNYLFWSRWYKYKPVIRDQIKNTTPDQKNTVQ